MHEKWRPSCLSISSMSTSMESKELLLAPLQTVACNTSTQRSGQDDFSGARNTGLETKVSSAQMDAKGASYYFSCQKYRSIYSCRKDPWGETSDDASITMMLTLAHCLKSDYTRRASLSPNGLQWYGKRRCRRCHLPIGAHRRLSLSSHKSKKGMHRFL